jgi:hypothetical protein
MGEAFAFARWVVLQYPWMSKEGRKPVFYACARDEWRLMKRSAPQHSEPQS